MSTLKNNIMPKEITIGKKLYNQIDNDIISYFDNDIDDNDELLEERSVLILSSVILNNPYHNEKHLAEILDSFEIIQEYTVSFQYLGIVLNLCGMYEDELKECENLTSDDADYIINMKDIKFYVFNK